MSGRYHYTLSFKGPDLDESRLRDLVATVSASDICIERQPLPRTPQVRLSVPEQAVVDLLADRAAHRSKEIKAHLTERFGASTRWPHLLGELVRVSVVTKVRHGVYALPDAPADVEVPPAQNQVERPTEDRLLSLLSTPKTAVDLREQLGVSRQRVDQLLKRLEAGGRVFRQRATGEAGLFVYTLTRDARAAPQSRTPRLNRPRARLLSSLRPDAAVSALSLAKVLPSYPRIINRMLRDMEAQGLTMTVKLAGQRYACLTSLGSEHPQYRPDQVVSPPTDLREALGETRMFVLQVLLVAAPLKTAQLTGLLSPEARRRLRRSLGHDVERLEAEGLVEPVKAPPGHAAYRLTPAGFAAGAFIRRTLGGPDGDQIQAALTAAGPRRKL